MEENLDLPLPGPSPRRLGKEGVGVFDWGRWGMRMRNGGVGAGLGEGMRMGGGVESSDSESSPKDAMNRWFCAVQPPTLTQTLGRPGPRDGLLADRALYATSCLTLCPCGAAKT
eukprot:748121-Hanusia_phi.AAC.8